MEPGTIQSRIDVCDQELERLRRVAGSVYEEILDRERARLSMDVVLEKRFRLMRLRDRPVELRS